MSPKPTSRSKLAEKIPPTDGRRGARVFMPRRRHVEREEQAGQILIFGVESASLTEAEQGWMKRIRPGGIILFRRNIEEAAQVTSLLRDADRLGTVPLLRCVDEEGGLVDRFREIIHPMPSAAAVFGTGKKHLYRRHGALIAREARALGFNTVFAPVLDLALQESSSVMRTRAVAAEPWRVIEYARYFLSGVAMEDILGCGKHFPGLGGATADSHQDTPVIRRQTRMMWRTDLAPWLAMAGKLPFAMVAHASYPWPGRDSAVATVSRYWVTNVLRRQVRFKGIILSDDMEMGGILSQMPLEEAVVKAVLAGIQMIPICRDPGLIERAWETLVRESERSAAFADAVASSWRKIYRSKKRWLQPMRRHTPSGERLNRICEEVKAFGQEVAEAPVHEGDPERWRGLRPEAEGVA